MMTDRGQSCVLQYILLKCYLRAQHRPQNQIKLKVHLETFLLLLKVKCEILGFHQG